MLSPSFSRCDPEPAIHMLPENASALVGAAVLSVAVFPILAISLHSKAKDGLPNGVFAVTAGRIADWLPEQIARVSAFISQHSK